jgi:FAD synthase
MLSIGKRPTVDGTIEKVEVNIFDFDQEIYGETITVQVHHYIRGQERYSSLDALKAQIDQDKKDSLRLLNKQ